MEREDFLDYSLALLKVLRQKHPEYHCYKNEHCGMCDRFYPCLFDLLQHIMQEAQNNTYRGNDAY